MYDPTNPAHIRRRAEEPLTQLRAATTLLQLIQEDAPAAKWEMDDDGHRLDGHILMLDSTDVDRRQALAAWQRILGAGPVEVRPVGANEHISVSGSYEGVPVRVVTIVDSQCPTCGTNEAHMAASEVAA